MVLASTSDVPASAERCSTRRGALHPGHVLVNIGKKILRIPYPRPQNPAYPARVLSNEGRFMRRSEVGQSESWPEGQPEGRCGAWGCARKHGPGRPWVSVRPVRVCHCELAGRGQASGAKSPCSRTSTGVCQVPGRTDQGFKTPRRDAERRCRVPLFSVSPGNMPRPLPRCAFRRSVSPQKGEIN
jgi:hypothetical protein